MKWYGVSLLAFVTLSTPMAEAKDAATGNDLLEWCKNPEQVFQAMCIVYVDGAISGSRYGASGAYLRISERVIWSLPQAEYEAFKNLSQAELMAQCIPEGVSIQQTIDILVKYLSDNPQNRHLPGAALYGRAMEEAFPCE